MHLSLSLSSGASTYIWGSVNTDQYYQIHTKELLCSEIFTNFIFLSFGNRSSTKRCVTKPLAPGSTRLRHTPMWPDLALQMRGEDLFQEYLGEKRESHICLGLFLGCNEQLG